MSVQCPNTRATYLRRVAAVVPRGERRALALVLFASAVAAVLEMAGAASILPFMALVMDPALAAHPALPARLAAWGAESHQFVLIAAGGVVGLILLAGNAAGAGALWTQQQFLARLRSALSNELFDGFLRHPYAFHVQHDTSSLMTIVVSDIDIFLANVVQPLLVAVGRGLAAAALVSLLVSQEPYATLVALAVLGTAYAAAYRLLRQRQFRLGVEINSAGLERIRSAYEGLSGVKELIVLGRQHTAATHFSGTVMRLARAQAKAAIAATLPRFVLETLAVSGVIGLTVWLIARGGSAQAAVPILALYAFAGYRLMPALQQLFAAAVALTLGRDSCERVERHLALARRNRPRDEQHAGAAPSADAPAMHRDLELAHVSFTYAGGARRALRDVCVTIRRNESIGIVGRSGSGKTTLADIVLGLYCPCEGTVAVDGEVLDARRLAAWRSRVGYVPQSVFLANATVRQNIAFGVHPDDIDDARVREAARLAHVDEFVSPLASGYETCIGERGVKLSGGQRQRIGIARALYHDPDVLVFDEATSALDGLTEDALMQAVRALSGRHTIVLIAHRLRTVKACDRVIMLEEGAVVADGSYHELMRTSLPFRRLAGSAGASADARDSRAVSAALSD